MTLPKTVALIGALGVIALIGCSSQEEVGFERTPITHKAPTASAAVESPKLLLPGADVLDPIAAVEDKAPFPKKKGKKKSDVELPPGWHSDYAKARAEAKQTGKPMLVLFH